MVPRLAGLPLVRLAWLVAATVLGEMIPVVDPGRDGGGSVMSWARIQLGFEASCRALLRTTADSLDTAHGLRAIHPVSVVASDGFRRQDWTGIGGATVEVVDGASEGDVHPCWRERVCVRCGRLVPKG